MSKLINPQPDFFHPESEQRKLEAMPYAPAVAQIKLFGKYRRIRGLIMPAFFALAIIVVIGILLCLWLVQLPAVQSFIATFPCVRPDPAVKPGFPLWVRITHLLTFIYLLFLVRSGINILLDHPRLYWTLNCTPGKEWLRWRGDVPKNSQWTSKDDSVTAPYWLGLPGGRHTIGIARHWHFMFDILFILTGAAFIILQFALGEWQRLVPTSWSLFPGAVTCALQYGSLHDPARIYGISGYVRFNALQQLTYFAIVFIVAPLQILTGIAMSPAFDNQFKWYQRIFGNRQIARSLHFLLMCFFILFYIGHMILVAYTGLLANLNGITLNINNTSFLGFWLTLLAVGGGLALTAGALSFSWKFPNVLQKISALTVNPIMDLVFDRSVRAQYKKEQISPYFWQNGKLPTSEEWKRLKENNWQDYRLKVSGLVNNPVDLSLEDIKHLTKKQQTTMHNCIQGWSGIAEWGGVPFNELIKLVNPKPEAHYAIFYSYGEGLEGGEYYDSHTMHDLEHDMSLLAYEMNYQPLNDEHGAPLRLRVENQLGFKMVKWIKAIEFVETYKNQFEGHGGYNEDHEFYGYRTEI
ncbi:oxidoreductase [Ktedonosporobacter rubrisoli]|uniref:Oxidoreductase n=1 Tax=Ktedonosporobacter rubrisoli TaxID=2509675 RepID=A0A4P6JMU8_KTERU|nr:molybdopterin-dependent oxidoreductase [Ktedonosporobacter rubrisoli]QBD76599.1 oxidoreductase [Ktedonosporobacter rubrisoli]